VRAKRAAVDPSLVVEVEVFGLIIWILASRFTIERDAKCRDESNIYVRSTDGKHPCKR
jgi:hypothetical protein